jgi:hypothetical protein
VLTAEDGVPVTYDDQGQSRPSACFGGAPQVVDALRTRQWRGSTEARREPRVTLTWPRATPEPMVDRAVGCLLGLAIGGDIEPALALARTLIGRTAYDPDAAHAAYALWLASYPRAPVNDPRTRAVPIGIWAGTPDKAAATARADAALTQADGATCDAAAAIAAAGARAIHGGTPDQSGQDRQIALALAGATQGRAGIPAAQAIRVLTWRPDDRPDVYWADDLCDVAEALLSAPRTHM